MSEWRGFRFTPDDVLFFRDGKPSTLGEDHYLASLFPPNPSTLYGALRTRRLLDEKADLARLGEIWLTLPEALRAEIGPWGGFGSLEQRGPWLLRGEEILVPAPADVGVVRVGPAVREVARYRLDEAPRAGGWSHSLSLFRPVDAAGKPLATAPASAAPDYWLTLPGLTTWAAGGVPAAEALVHRDELYRPEPRTGVGLEAGHRLAAKHKLFTFGFVRLAPGVDLGFEVRGTALAAEGGLRLGGDAKMGELSPGPALALPEPPEAAGRFTLCFLTAALSSRGAYPPEACARLKLLGAHLRGAALVGGWDLATGRSKPLRRAIPPGSVFVFDDAEGDAAAALHGRNLCDFPGEALARQGFGLAVAGKL
jgi:CRISPR-associated protein Cmr3